jgi:uncharacterized MnhB-related membrane protein
MIYFNDMKFAVILDTAFSACVVFLIIIFSDVLMVEVMLCSVIVLPLYMMSES